MAQIKQLTLHLKQVNEHNLKGNVKENFIGLFKINVYAPKFNDYKTTMRVD